MVGPWDEDGTEGNRSGSRERRSQHARRGRGQGLGLALGKAEPGRETGTRTKTWREAQGRNEVYEGNAFEDLDKDLNKAYLIYKKKRLRKKGKLFEEKEEASLYTRIITLLINPDNARTGKRKQRRERDEERTGEGRRQERTGQQERGTEATRQKDEARKDKDSGAYSDARQNRSRRE
ncbi:hypothetical protein DFP73DRAFT_599851 [Morchella snyderi]|nr:hypothetical protein DFP73DRAFT_599851 [Morchella snyderi]